MAHLEPIPANAIATAVLAVAGICDGSIQDLQFSRVNPLPPPPFIKKESFQYTPIIGPEAPPRLESNLPPPGSLSARLVLGERIGAGAVGTVFEAEIDYENSNPELRDSLPPLVVKISLPLKSKRLNWEAACYEDMEPLYGVVVPRYYGFFQLEIPANLDFKYWHGEEVYNSSTEDEEFDDDPTLPRTVSLLILERVRGPLPVGRPLRDVVREDLLDMYSDLSRLSILHKDVRYPNILRAPKTGFPGLPSPYTGRTYRAHQSYVDHMLHMTIIASDRSDDEPKLLMHQYRLVLPGPRSASHSHQTVLRILRRSDCVPSMT
ncbi:unnamed protein product [Somion occarium]|uniref:Protein kinase domain-containing protein n=1 Tax=Somion occarium TaxID=3059160 RepID=A0ABP1E127_9APHY